LHFFLSLAVMSASEPPFVPLYIDGQHRPAKNGASFPVFNSFTGAIVSSAASATSEDCVAAIEAAQRAQPAWEALGPHARARLLLKVSALVESEEWLAKARKVVEEEMSAAPGMQAFSTAAARYLRIAAGMANELVGETFPSGAPGGQAIVQRRAHGVMHALQFWSMVPSDVMPCAAILSFRGTVRLSWPPAVLPFLRCAATPSSCVHRNTHHARSRS
jgi:hypothetical protein